MSASVTFARVERIDLTDDARLSQLYLDAVRRGWWPAGPAAVLDFWALAEKALQEDSQGTPGRLFHSLVKSKERGRITNGQEQRAQRRMPSHARDALVARADAGSAPDRQPVAHVAAPAIRTAVSSDLSADMADLWEADPDRVVYHHSIMMMCFLPQKRLPDAQRHYVVRHGRAALRIEAGTLIDPAEVGTFRSFPVPFGSRARLILPYINGYALRNQTRTVDLGRSLRAFMTRIGLSFDGRRGRQIMEQVQALAAAHLVLGLWDGPSGRSHAHLATVADEISFWIERDARQRALWEPEMTLSQRYYDAIRDRPVPLDMEHLVQLARSPRRMDIYAWLTYRTAQIPPGRPVRVRLSALQPVFAPDLVQFRSFKHRFCGDLAALGRVYGGFRVSVDGDLLVLERSPSPIGRRAFVSVAGPADGSSK